MELEPVKVLKITKFGKKIKKKSFWTPKGVQNVANYKIPNYLLPNTFGIFYFVVNFYLKSGEKLFFLKQ